MNQDAKEHRIRLVLLEAQALLRVRVARFLASQPGLEVVRECAAAGEAADSLRASAVDVALLSLGGGSETESGFIAAARREGYRGRFLIVAETADGRRAAAAIQSGASGIFLKSESPGRLADAVRIVAAGGVWLDPMAVREMAGQLADVAPQPDSQGSVCVLTYREQEVLLGILGGLTNRKIGVRLGLSETCVKTSIRRMFQKTGARRRSQLVRVALERSLAAVAGTPPPS